MSLFDRRPALRWAVPAAAVVLIVAGTAAGSVSASPGLPAKSASELLVDLQGAQPTPLSGTVESHADLGLPDLPNMGGSGTGAAGTDMTSLASGTHTLRVWTDGAQRSRVALLGQEQETDIYRDGTSAWLWSSTDRTAEHLVVSPPSGSPTMPEGLANGLALPSTPQEAAEQVLAALDPSTTVTSTTVAKVAGRPVYELVLTPKQDDTLVSKVAIAVDSETSIPLRVQVFSRQLQEPAFEIGFTSVDFGPVPDSALAFVPPAGVTVKDHAVDASAQPEMDPGDRPAQAPHAAPTVIGSGWQTVVIATMPPSTDATPTGQIAGLIEMLPKSSGAWGSGRVLAGTLFSVILTDDGRIAVGAVTPDALGAALAAA